MRHLGAVFFAFAATGAVSSLLVSPSVASAQEVVSVTGKGIVGGAMLGAEAVMVGEVAFGVRPWWAYVAGGVVGGAAGGLGGYYAEQAGGKLPLYLLAGGMVLAIPTTVAVLDATSYRPPSNFRDAQPSDDELPADPAAPAAAPPPREAALLLPPPSLVAWHRDSLWVGVPGVHVGERFSSEERFRFSAPKATEVQFGLVSAAF